MDAIRLILVTNCREADDDKYFSFIRRCAIGGVSAVQVRAKNVSPEILVEIVKKVKKAIDGTSVALFINDDVHAALKLGADGVHLGQKDMHPDEAREILGAKKIIGLSIETLEELEIANQLTSIDYVAASAVFPTKNKKDIKTIWDLKGLKSFAESSKHPVVGIGGINSKNVSSVVKAGARGIAVIGAIHDATDTVAAARMLRSKINKNLLEEIYV